MFRNFIWLVVFATPFALRAETFSFSPIIIPGSSQTEALGINASGTVLVYSLNAGGAYYLWKDGVSTQVPLPFAVPFSEGGINDYEAITGPAPNQLGGTGFILDSGLTLFRVPGALRTDALGINNSESVVGWFLSPGGRSEGFVRSPTGDFSIIDIPNSLATKVNGINNAGDVVGYYTQSRIHGFLLRQGVFTELSDPGHFDIEPQAIDDRGDIVGSYVDSPGGIHGFLLSDGTYSTIDYPGALYTVALGVNSTGSIVGLYVTPTQINGFVATPVAVPEPAAIPIVSAALIGIALKLRCRSSRTTPQRRMLSPPCPLQ